MSWFSRYVILFCVALLFAVGGAMLGYTVTLASRDLLWSAILGVARALGPQLPALGIICGGGLVVIGIVLLGGPREREHRRYRYTRASHGRNRATTEAQPARAEAPAAQDRMAMPKPQPQVQDHVAEPSVVI